MKNSKVYQCLGVLFLMCLVWIGIFFYFRNSESQKNLFKDIQPYEDIALRNYNWETRILAERVKGYESPIDFTSLWEINEDVIGWLKIPGTAIDYPILYTDRDNDTYLYHTIEGEYSQYGSIYLDFQSTPDFTGRHNVIYGHNMRNGSMFHDIVKFKEKDYYDSHQEIYIYTPEREIALKPIAVFPIRAYWWIRLNSFVDEGAFLTYAETLTGYHKFGDVSLEGVSRLYTFITCSYEWEDTRTLLIAVETE